MRGKHKLVILALLLVVVLFVVGILLNSESIAVLNPAGQVASEERDLIMFTSLLSLVVVIPVFAMLFIFAWKYREGNQKAEYAPDWDHSKSLEFIWWAVPLLIITVLAIVTWKSSHDLDPFKPLNSSVKPITIQVVALQWKWLFIYPEQNIATVNFVQFPVNTPVNFEITADAPMNSFWIPRLGGQIYAMSGMSTKLHLIANETGSYNGASANISGEGFSGMKFTAKASSSNDFAQWVQLVQQSRNNLSFDEYNNLAKPSKDVTPIYYASKENDLYSTVIVKYMAPGAHTHKTGSY